MADTELTALESKEICEKILKDYPDLFAPVKMSFYEPYKQTLFEKQIGVKPWRAPLSVFSRTSIEKKLPPGHPDIHQPSEPINFIAPIQTPPKKKE
jgi:hypothetical protein